MSLLTPLWLEDSSYSATEMRELIDSVFSSAGIIGSGDLLVAQRAAGANMSIDVAVGSCVVVGTDISGQGKYLCKSDAVTNVTIATAPSTGNSRIDLIVAQVRDEDAVGGSNNDWIITAVTGTAATTGTQMAPSAPASSLVLAQIAVGPTVSTIVTANITDERPSVNDTGWTPITSFLNGYSNNGSAGISAYRVLNGVVWMRVNLLVGTVFTPAFTFPSSYWPPADIYIAGAALGVDTGLVTVVVLATGDLKFINDAGSWSGRIDGLFSYPLG